MTPHTFDRDFATAMALHGLEEGDRDMFLETWTMNQHLVGQDEGIRNLAQFTQLLRRGESIGAKGKPRGATVSEANAGPAPTGRPQPPRQLDKAGATLYREIEARADQDRTEFFAAMGALTGVQEYADLGPELMSPRELAELGPVDPASQVTDQAARVLVRTHAVDYVDAAEHVELMQQIGVAKAETGASEFAWRDTRVLETPPVPWSEDDWQRDRRRAVAAGIELSREEWEAAAEEGRDAPGEQAELARRERVETLEQHFARSLVGAQEREAEKRADAINRELARQATERLGSRGTTLS